MQGNSGEIPGTTRWASPARTVGDQAVHAETPQALSSSLARQTLVPVFQVAVSLGPVFQAAVSLGPVFLGPVFLARGAQRQLIRFPSS